MHYKHCCVIDAEQNFKEFVLVVEGVIQHYVLQEGESIIDAPFPPSDLAHPKWQGEKWLEIDVNAILDGEKLTKAKKTARGKDKKMTGGKNDGV